LDLDGPTGGSHVFVSRSSRDKIIYLATPSSLGFSRPDAHGYNPRRGAF